MKNFISFYRNTWYKLTFPVFTTLAFYMLFLGVHQFSDMQLILMASLMALLIHQFEEYVLPGGAPVIINLATFSEKENFLRYPGNMHSSMWVNTLAHIAYTVAVIFPDWIWLGIGTMCFNLFQFVGHGIQMNKALKTWYNPGLASVLFLFIPIASYYFYYINSHELVSGWDWALGGLGFVGLLLVTTIAPVQYFKNPNTPYPITDEQYEKFKKITALCRLK
ncbi:MULTISPECIES: HXXEE domain-containing protein [Glaesserella]|uniref:HXXEE domain-containing protein n=1 Tax=Glaesserella australis TaxID=2094024 RepID=A0A328C2C1_9PAST|nr:MULTISPECIES: HXXEE domain-containing protein [Glaesserella]AUI66880.1 HXXEE domain-containing protein [Glaesserella sp. 15-184]RAL19931.1 HXXEE domain-containing protein [Glaesserella australis]